MRRRVSGSRRCSMFCSPSVRPSSRPLARSLFRIQSLVPSTMSLTSAMKPVVNTDMPPTIRMPWKTASAVCRNVSCVTWVLSRHAR